MSEIKDFLKYIIRQPFAEAKGFARNFFTLKPKTIVYLIGTAFLFTWFLGLWIWSTAFLIALLGALLYKEWVAGDWKREAREKLRKEIEKKAKEQSNRDPVDGSKVGSPPKQP